MAFGVQASCEDAVSKLASGMQLLGSHPEASDCNKYLGFEQLEIIAKSALEQCDRSQSEMFNLPNTLVMVVGLRSQYAPVCEKDIASCHEQVLVQNKYLAESDSLFDSGHFCDASESLIRYLGASESVTSVCEGVKNVIPTISEVLRAQKTIVKVQDEYAERCQASKK